MKKKNISLLAGLLIAFVFLLGSSAFADGFPSPWQLNLQAPASPVAEQLNNFHQMLLIITFGISGFVLALLLIVIVRFNKKANPEPRLFAHNTPLEIVWTVLPVLILIVIAIPSIKLLYFMDRTVEPEMTLKVTGYQWYWGYEYPDQDGLSFSSYMIPEKDIDPEAGQLRLLSVDNPIVLPVDTNIQILVTAGDVLHSFAVPALGVKKDAVPGRINETWVRITRPGIYYGQCSELCGKDHAYMPIEIHAVTKEEFERWIETAADELASVGAPQSLKLALAEQSQQ